MIRKESNNTIVTFNSCYYILLHKVRFLTWRKHSTSEYNICLVGVRRTIHICQDIAESSSESPTNNQLFHVYCKTFAYVCDSWITNSCSICSFSPVAEWLYIVQMLFHSCPVRFFFPETPGWFCSRGVDLTASRKSLLLILRRFLTLLLFSFWKPPARFPSCCCFHLSFSFFPPFTSFATSFVCFIVPLTREKEVSGLVLTDLLVLLLWIDCIMQFFVLFVSKSDGLQLGILLEHDWIEILGVHR